MTGKNSFLAVYNDKDRCIGIFDNFYDLAKSKLMGETTAKSLREMCSRYTRLHQEQTFKTIENDTAFCSLKIFASPPKLNNDFRFNKRKFNYSIYKFWEEKN